MSQKTYHRIAVGWVKQNRNGGDYVSATTKSKDSTLQVFVRDDTGKEIEISNFAMMWNNNKKKDTHPDVHFVFTTED